MPSPTYELFAEAIRDRRRVACWYGGLVRELCPVILGHSRGKEKALTYQVGGESSSGLPPRGEWRCLFLERVSSASLHEGSWRVGSNHTRPQGCVEIVDLDANPASPYKPKRRHRS